MDYKKFCQLLDSGEKNNVDFKINCNAFASREIIAPKAELAKDICAMANNGKIASYIIVGVSDDNTNFQSVSNTHLTDDALQDFCKKSIFPPPKVKLLRLQWNKTRPEHENKEFVVIQIGPQKRGTFRLLQNFIQYNKRVCYRRNEVWIRRGATSDLATPEEIFRLINGESIEETPDDAQRKEDRNNFSQLSLDSRLSLVKESVFQILIINGYELISESGNSNTFFGELQSTGKTFMKRLDTGVIIVMPFQCYETLTKRLFRNSEYFFTSYFYDLNELPKKYKPLKKSRDVRRVWLLPIIRSVPKSSAQRILSQWSWSDINLHCYSKSIRLPRWSGKISATPTSNEILIIDKIESISDLREKLTHRLSQVEVITGTVMDIK